MKLPSFADNILLTPLVSQSVCNNWWVCIANQRCIFCLIAQSLSLYGTDDDCLHTSIYRWLTVQDCNICIANALEILQSCIKPSICTLKLEYVWWCIYPSSVDLCWIYFYIIWRCKRCVDLLFLAPSHWTNVDLSSNVFCVTWEQFHMKCWWSWPGTCFHKLDF